MAHIAGEKTLRRIPAAEAEAETAAARDATTAEGDAEGAGGSPWDSLWAVSPRPAAAQPVETRRRSFSEEQSRRERDARASLSAVGRSGTL